MSSDLALVLLVATITGLFLLWFWERLLRAVGLHKSVPPPLRQRLGTGRSSSKLRILDGPQLALLCAEVAARLRAGESVDRAWTKSLNRVEAIGNVSMEDLKAVLLKSGEPGWTVLTTRRFANQTGSPLAAVLERASHALNEREKSDESVKVAFAGPRASARVLSALPVVGILGAEVLGAKPIEWFLGSPIRLALAAFGLVLAVSGHRISQEMIKRASKASEGRGRAPVLADLAAAGLQSGLAIPTVLKAIGSSSSESQYIRVGRELELGATWSEAWDPLPPSGTLLYEALEPAWVDGISPTRILDSVAERFRLRISSEANQAAQKLGVKLAFPLGLLLLPSFVVLGLLPIFFSLVGSQIGLTAN